MNIPFGIIQFNNFFKCFGKGIAYAKCIAKYSIDFIRIMVCGFINDFLSIF